MQEDRDDDTTAQTTRRGRRDADVSALTGLGVILYLVSAVLTRVAQNDVAATVVGLVSLVPFGAAVVIAVRRRLGGAIAVPALAFVGVAIVSAVRLA